MAIIKCPECGKEVSDKAKVCIHCGAPLTEDRRAADKTESAESIRPMTKREKNIALQKELRKDPIYFACEIISCVGIILLLIGIFVEVNFQMNYDTSGLTNAGVNALRQLAGTEYSIPLIIAGLVIAILPGFYELPLLIRKKKEFDEKYKD